MPHRHNGGILFVRTDAAASLFLLHGVATLRRLVRLLPYASILPSAMAAAFRDRQAVASTRSA